LSLPGKAKGVLNLVNRSHDDRELTFERKSGLQLLGRGRNNERLNDTAGAIRTLLKRAGLGEADQALGSYLETGRRNGNRVSASALLNLLNQHLPQPEAQPGIEVANMAKADEESADLGKALAQMMKHSSASDVFDDKQLMMRALLKQAVAERLGIQVQQPVQARRPEQYAGSDLYPPKTVGTSVNELLRNAQMSVPANGILGEGGFGMARKLRVQGQQELMVLKTFKQGKEPKLSQVRNGRPNEAIAAYLTSRRDKTYAGRVNVVQPDYYLVEKSGTFMMLDPLALRALLKDSSSKGNVLCVGTVMKMAEGEEIFSMANQLSPAQRKQVLKGTLQSVSVLNERGFVHRDIKPENAFFDAGTGKVSLIDTGLLHKSSRRTAYADTVSNFAGTRLYMHPKILMSRPYGTEADLYASAMMALRLESPLAAGILNEDYIKPVYDVVKKGGSLRPVDRFFNREMLVEAINMRLARLPASGGSAVQAADRAELKRVKADLADPNSLASFIMDCLMLATDPPEKTNWRDRAQAADVYRQLLSDPRLNRV
jgi:serine/threonine protein kinase